MSPLPHDEPDIEALVSEPGPSVRKRMIPLPCGCVVETTATGCPHYKLTYVSLPPLPEETP